MKDEIAFLAKASCAFIVWLGFCASAFVFIAALMLAVTSPVWVTIWLVWG